MDLYNDVSINRQLFTQLEDQGYIQEAKGNDKTDLTTSKLIVSILNKENYEPINLFNKNIKQW